jgi:hypothetical protein
MKLEPIALGDVPAGDDTMIEKLEGYLDHSGERPR